ncbi:putative virulence effector [Golovinomyces cichoracearum]|uniref:Putative virulence effector n=1 Tax=Golovinomyces cichoracearum TaxID=62708 RepID=A0A420HM37_9PEZI|nr:putative virulence effector [Golovinomyces cichoracearum]
MSLKTKEARITLTIEAIGTGQIRVQELRLRKAIGQLEKVSAQVLKRFARGEEILENNIDHIGFSQSIYAKSKSNASKPKPSNAQTLKTYLPSASEENLSKNLPTTLQQVTWKSDSRIFVRLPMNHPGHAYHVNSVKAALSSKLELESGTVKIIQKLKSGIAIVPTTVQHGQAL